MREYQFKVVEQIGGAVLKCCDFLALRVASCRVDENEIEMAVAVSYPFHAVGVVAGNVGKVHDSAVVLRVPTKRFVNFEIVHRVCHLGKRHAVYTHATCEVGNVPIG